MARATTEVVWMRLHKEGRKRLAKLLLIQGVTQRELATVAGYRFHGHISQLLSGKRTGCKAEAACAIAKYLGVSVEDLFVTELLSVAPQATRSARDAA